MTSNFRIEPGQEYQYADPRDNIRVRVVAVGPDRVDVVDAVTGKRPRSVLRKSFHDNPVRTSGYRLVQHADGSAA